MNDLFNHIRYLKRQQIDPQQWDACIDQSPNGMIYASSSYLDEMALHWDALVLGNYEAVMPLTWNRKWGIRYLYQPPLSPQLGVFSRQRITEEIVGAFLKKARSHFKFAEIYLNFTNEYPGLQPFTNIVLNLNAPYEQLRANYKKDLEKNIRRAAGFSLQYSPSSDVGSAIDLYKQYYAARTPHVREADYRRFTQFCNNALKTDSVIIRRVEGPGERQATAEAQNDQPSTAAALKDQRFTAEAQNDQPPVAVALLLKRRDRLYLLMSVCSPDGRKMEANHFLLDNLIREFAATNTILDFDGSEIPGIAHFYRNFGGFDQPFFFYRYNRLPWPLRLLKPAGSQHSLDIQSPNDHPAAD